MKSLDQRVKMTENEKVEFDTDSYLERIHYRGPLRPTIEVLRNLHRCQMLSVPFENLDIHRGRKIILDSDLFYKKIVYENRGGYCYELNGCFAGLLRKLGFRTTTLSARVAGKHGFSPEFDHMTLLVHLGDRWLADVGFGDSFTRPIRVDSTDPQHDERDLYRVIRNGLKRTVLRRRKSNTWDPLYAFSLRPRKLADFAARNVYQQTSPSSHFTQQRLISQLTKSGRVTLTDHMLVLTKNGKRLETPVKNQKHFAELLLKHFGLTI